MLAIIGSRGQLGRELEERAANMGFAVVGMALPECDITDSASLRRCVETARGVELIINAAAYTAVDRSESEPLMAMDLNRDAPGRLAALCCEKRIPLIHISTDYVFDGTARRPYTPEDPVTPLGVYGRSKAEGENAVRAAWDRHVIVRTSWLFGRHGQNFVKTMLRLGQEREELRVVNDQVGSPTYAGDLATALMTISRHVLLKQNGWGTYHFCNQGVLSWYDFTRKIFELAERYTQFRVRRILPITTPQYPTPAARPAYSALDCSSMEKRFGVERRPYEQALAEMLHAVYASAGKYR